MSDEFSARGFICPGCGGDLRFTDTQAICVGCSAHYAIDSGIPILLASRECNRERDEQASWFDNHVDTAYEVSRPHGTPRFHRWLMEEKFRRGTRGLALQGASGLTVCGGSGMDAEFLARAGASVISADVSFGAARRVQERSHLSGVDITPIVADAEALPFRGSSIDVVAVHDGLHHVQHPYRALAEMLRVARSGVSITEPADALITRGAVRAGLALEREEAGNPVNRLDLREVVDTVERAGFEIVRAERYGMYYAHEPGLPSRLLSAPVAFEVATTAFTLVNRLGGQLGNKLAVVAIRR